MKIKLISDLHHDFDADRGKSFIDSLPNKDIDVLVIAGDICERDLIEKCLTQYCDKFPHVVYVPGNHCQWKGSLSSFEDLMKDISLGLPNLYYLNNAKKEIMGKTFAGTTLWFPNLGRHLMHNLGNWIDCRFVSGGSASLFAAHDAACNFLRTTDADIVVTHHLPSYKCISPRWADSDYNCYFASNVEDIIYLKKPKYWLCGHSHDPCDIKLFDTQIVRNPRGYPNEGVAFDPNLILEINT